MVAVPARDVWEGEVTPEPHATVTTGAAIRMISEDSLATDMGCLLCKRPPCSSSRRSLSKLRAERLSWGRFASKSNLRLSFLRFSATVMPEFIRNLFAFTAVDPAKDAVDQ